MSKIIKFTGITKLDLPVDTVLDAAKETLALRARLAQPEMNQWHGLTDEEINSVRHNRDWTAFWTDTTFARAIEAKLREKNHG